MYSSTVPYVWTDASAGTLHGMKGFQDIEVDLKYEFYKTKIGKGEFFADRQSGDSARPLRTMKMISCPCPSDWAAPIFPGRLTVDYQNGIFFTTLSSAYRMEERCHDRQNFLLY